MRRIKKVMMIALVAIVMAMPIFGAETAYIRLNAHVKENVGNTGIRVANENVLRTYSHEAFDTAFFAAVNDVSVLQNKDVSLEAGQTGDFYALVRRAENKTIKIKVEGGPLKLNGGLNKIPYTVTGAKGSFTTTGGHIADTTEGHIATEGHITYKAAPVGGIVRSYEKFTYTVKQTKTAPAGSYTATITFTIEGS